MTSEAYARICAWDNLLAAWRKAARGKRGGAAAARFECTLADSLLTLRDELLEGRYRSGGYVHFHIHEPKRRKISAAPFRDRVVHHALCNVIEPRFERMFSPESYANRVGKGTHRALDRLQELARRYRYALRADIVQHFASIDHVILLGTIGRVVPEEDVMELIERIVASGDGVLAGEYDTVWFPGDDLLAACRPRGLPIGNLTSQFWSNCYMHPFDEFVKRELRSDAYVRYVDDFALFSDSKQELWRWRQAVIDRLARLRLVIHESAAQVALTRAGIPWLGFVVFPTHRRVKARKVVHATRRLAERLNNYHAGSIGFDALDASVKGWVNHDTWGLRRHVLSRLNLRAPRGPYAGDARDGSTHLADVPGTGTWPCSK